jgi:hypothetical protein
MYKTELELINEAYYNRSEQESDEVSTQYDEMVPVSMEEVVHYYIEMVSDVAGDGREATELRKFANFVDNNSYEIRASG